MKERLEISLQSLYEYCRLENYKGWDNFDGLNSVLFQKTPLIRYPLSRLIWTQFFKRSFVNFRPLTLVPKGFNPKGLALFVRGLVLLDKHCEARCLLGSLSDMSCQGFSDKCWGYNFDWQSRGGFTPKETPNAVATIFVANAFLDFFDKTRDEEYLETAKSCCQFIMKHLVGFEDDKTVFFSYFPASTTRVHNVNMLASALLARVFSITGEQELYRKSEKAMVYSIGALQADSSWTYGEAETQKFVDNFHTGFNLVALCEWIRFTGNDKWKTELKKSYQYFLENFWLKNGCPKYYNTTLFPIDIHASAQGIVTCLNLNRYDEDSRSMALKIAAWAIEHMQDESGYFYYQKTRFYNNKISYMRWSQAWMFYALCLMVSFQDLDS